MSAAIDELLPVGTGDTAISLLKGDPILHTKAIGYAAICGDRRFSEEVRLLAKSELDKIINTFIDRALGRDSQEPRYRMIKGAKVRIR